MLKTGRFTRDERVKRSAEIKNIFKNGKKVSEKGAKLFFLKNNTQKNRIAFALCKGYGNAVERNRAKRISREVYRFTRNKIQTGYDMIYLVYPGNDDFNKRCKIFECLVEKAGIVKI